jgi:hypothetical protein
MPAWLLVLAPLAPGARLYGGVLMVFKLPKPLPSRFVLHPYTVGFRNIIGTLGHHLPGSSLQPLRSVRTTHDLWLRPAAGKPPFIVWLRSTFQRFGRHYNLAPGVCETYGGL